MLVWKRRCRAQNFSTKLCPESGVFYWTPFSGGFQCCTWGALFASQIFCQARCQAVVIYWKIKRHTGSPNPMISLSEHKELMQVAGQRADWFEHSVLLSSPAWRGSVSSQKKKKINKSELDYVPLDMLCTALSVINSEKLLVREIYYNYSDCGASIN